MFWKRIDLDEPLTLLDENFEKIREKILNSTRHSEHNDGCRSVTFYNHKYEDVKQTINMRSSIKIFSIIEHDRKGKIEKSGKIYFDKSEKFIDDIINTITKRLYSTRKKDIFIYDKETFVCIDKEYDDTYNRWKLTVMYWRHNTEEKEKKRKEEKKTTKEKQNRNLIEKDVKKNFKGLFW